MKRRRRLAPVPDPPELRIVDPDAPLAELDDARRRHPTARPPDPKGNP